MDMSTINWLAVLVAGLSAFLLGGLWYSPILFYRQWLEANGFTDEQVQAGANPARSFGFSFVFALLMAVNLAMFLNDPSTTAGFGAFAGFAAGFGWAGLGLGIVALFEQRPWSYILINGGYLTVALTVMGVILGAWR